MHSQVWSAGNAIFKEHTFFCSMGSKVTDRVWFSAVSQSEWGVLWWLFSLSWCLLSYWFEVLTVCTTVQSWYSPPRGGVRLHGSKAESPTTGPHSRCQTQVWGPQVTCISDQLSVNSMTSSRVIIYPNDSQNPRKCYDCDYSFIVKDKNQDQPKEEAHGMRSGQVPHAELLCPLPWN